MTYLAAAVRSPGEKKSASDPQRNDQPKRPRTHGPTASGEEHCQRRREAEEEHTGGGLVAGLFVAMDPFRRGLQTLAALFRGKITGELDGNGCAAEQRQGPKSQALHDVALSPPACNQQEDHQRKADDGDMIERQMNLNPVHAGMLP